MAKNLLDYLIELGKLTCPMPPLRLHGHSEQPAPSIAEAEMHLIVTTKDPYALDVIRKHFPHLCGG